MDNIFFYICIFSLIFTYTLGNCSLETCWDNDCWNEELKLQGCRISVDTQPDSYIYFVSKNHQYSVLELTPGRYLSDGSKKIITCSNSHNSVTSYCVNGSWTETEELNCPSISWKLIEVEIDKSALILNQPFCLTLKLNVEKYIPEAIVMKHWDKPGSIFVHDSKMNVTQFNDIYYKNFITIDGGNPLRTCFIKLQEWMLGSKIVYITGPMDGNFALGKLITLQLGCIVKVEQYPFANIKFVQNNLQYIILENVNVGDYLHHGAEKIIMCMFDLHKAFSSFCDNGVWSQLPNINCPSM